MIPLIVHTIGALFIGSLIIGNHAPTKQTACFFGTTFCYVHQPSRHWFPKGDVEPLSPHGHGDLGR